MIVVENRATWGNFLKARFVIFRCQKYVKKGYIEMTKKIYLETFKGCARSLCFPLLLFYSIWSITCDFRSLGIVKMTNFRGKYFDELCFLWLLWKWILKGEIPALKNTSLALFSNLFIVSCFQYKEAWRRYSESKISKF